MNSLSVADLEVLGRRAKLRRCDIGQSGATIEAIIKMTPGLLRQWEKKLPRKPKKELEDAWEDALLVPRDWLRNPQMHPVVGDTAKLENLVIDISIYECETVSDEIRCIGAWLSRSVWRRRTVRFEDLTGEEARRASIFAERYGVSGDATLQTIGDRYGLTRERIRQIVEKMAERLNGVTFTAPVIFKLKQLVQDSTPIALSIFNDNHHDLLGEKLSLEDADRFSREVLGIGIAVISDRSMGHTGNAIKRTVLSAQNEEENGLTVVVRDSARRMIRSCGAAQIMFVTGMASEMLNKSISITEVRKSIQSIEGMEWIIEDDGWFWFGLDTASNRAVEIARKVLSVTINRIDVEEIQQAICRNRIRRTSYHRDPRNKPPMLELPRHVLCEVLSRLPYLAVVQYDDFIVKEKINTDDVLSETELVLYNTLKQHNGVASRNTLYKEAVGKNFMSAINFQVLLSSSPIIRPFAVGLFMLRGWDITIESIQKAFESRPGSSGCPLLPDRDGWIEFELRMTASKLRELNMDLPAAAMSIPHGDYRFEGMVNGVFGIGASKNGISPRRFNQAFVRSLQDAGVKDTDVIFLKLHSELRRVIVSSNQSRQIA